MSVFIDLLRSDGSIIINKNLINALGLEAAVLFGELLSKQNYYKKRNETIDGWFYETADMLEINTGLSYYQQRKSLETLINEKLIEVSVKGLPAKKYFKVTEDETLIRNILERGKAKKEAFLNKFNEEEKTTNILKTSFEETKELDSGKLKNKNIENLSVINNRINNNRNNKNTYIVENKKNEKQEAIPYKEIVEYLNEKAGKQYRDTTPKTRELIKARWNEGFRLEDFKKVIDNKTLLWKGTEMETYLRPVTLFSTKFESYLNEDPSVIKRIKPKENYNIKEFFDGLDYDYIVEINGNEYLAKKRFNEYAEKYGVDKDARALFKDFVAWCKKLVDEEKKSIPRKPDQPPNVTLGTPW